MPIIDDNLACRACLTKTGDFVSIHKTVIVGNPMNTLTLLDCWNHCMRSCDNEGSLADVEAILPNYVCLLCSEDLQVAYNFIKNASEALATLQKQIVAKNYNNDSLELLAEDDNWKIINQGSYNLIAENREVCDGVRNSAADSKRINDCVLNDKFEESEEHTVETNKNQPMNCEPGNEPYTEQSRIAEAAVETHRNPIVYVQTADGSFTKHPMYVEDEEEYHKFAPRIEESVTKSYTNLVVFVQAADGSYQNEIVHVNAADELSTNEVINVKAADGPHTIQIMQVEANDESQTNQVIPVEAADESYTNEPTHVETANETHINQSAYSGAEDESDTNNTMHAEAPDESEELKDEENETTVPDLPKFRAGDVEDKMDITCMQCTQKFRTYRRFEDHMYEHRGMYPYICHMCTQRVQSLRGIVQHYSKSHNIEPTLEHIQPKACENEEFGPADFEPRTRYICVYCNFEHVNFRLVKKHLMEIHEINDVKHILKKLPYQCPKCLRCFTTREKVINHSEFEHSNRSYSSTVRIRKYAHCQKCGRKLEQCLLAKHEIHCHGKVKTFQCRLCSKTFLNRTTLMAHRREAHPMDPNIDSPFRCDICGNTYRTRIQLRFHIKRHDARNFKCNQCDRTYIRPLDLRKHQLIHTGQLPYKCDVCFVSYRHLHALQDHKERTHVKKSYGCKVDGCEAEFRTRSQLNDHKYKHIGNPYKCELCPKDFLRRESMRRHGKAVHNIMLTDMDLTKIYQKHAGRYNAHDIRKMAGNQ